MLGKMANKTVTPRPGNIVAEHRKTEEIDLNVLRIQVKCGVASTLSVPYENITGNIKPDTKESVEEEFLIQNQTDHESRLLVAMTDGRLPEQIVETPVEVGYVFWTGKCYKDIEGNEYSSQVLEHAGWILAYGRAFPPHTSKSTINSTPKGVVRKENWHGTVVFKDEEGNLYSEQQTRRVQPEEREGLLARISRLANKRLI